MNAQHALHAAPPDGTDCLDIQRGMRQTGGRQALYWTLLGLFADHHAGTAGTLGRLLQDGDLASARRVAHTLRGSAAQIGAGVVERHAALLEDALRQPGPGPVPAGLLPALEGALSALLALLATQAPDFRALAQPPAASLGPGSRPAP